MTHPEARPWWWAVVLVLATVTWVGLCLWLAVLVFAWLVRWTLTWAP